MGEDKKHSDIYSVPPKFFFVIYSLIYPSHFLKSYQNHWDATKQICSYGNHINYRPPFACPGYGDYGIYNQIDDNTDKINSSKNSGEAVYITDNTITISCVKDG